MTDPNVSGRALPEIHPRQGDQMDARGNRHFCLAELHNSIPGELGQI